MLISRIVLYTGYGDLLPLRRGTRLLTILLIFFLVGGMAQAIEAIADWQSRSMSGRVQKMMDMAKVCTTSRTQSSRNTRHEARSAHDSMSPHHLARHALPRLSRCRTTPSTLAALAHRVVETAPWAAPQLWMQKWKQPKAWICK